MTLDIICPFIVRLYESKYFVFLEDKIKTNGQRYRSGDKGQGQEKGHDQGRGQESFATVTV